MDDQDSSRYTYEDIIELLPAFVVGSLDPEEMFAVEEYLETHPDLMARVQQLETTAARLAYAAPWRPLPAGIQAKVRERARATLPPAGRTAPAAQRLVQPAPPRQPEPQRGGLAAWWRRRGAFDLALVAAVAAALILGVLLRQALVGSGDLQRRVQLLEQQIATVQAENTTLQVENLQLQEQLQTQLNQLASLAGAEQMVALAGTEDAPEAHGTLYVSDNEGTLVLNNLTELGDEQVYQLWLIPPDGAPIPAGLLGQAGEEVETISLALPSTLDNIAAVGISIEPPGGSAAPTGPIVLLGQKA